MPVVKRGDRVAAPRPTSAVVRTDHQPVWGEGVVNDGDGLLLIVQKFRGANTMEVTKGVEDAIDEMQPGLPGVEIDTTIFRPATFIEQSIDNLTRALLIGILLVILIIVAFLFDLADGVHQPDRDPAVADRGDPGARPARRDHQRDGARRIGGRHRGGGRRCDHRCGEHRATLAPSARGGQRRVHVQDRARRLGRGAKRDHLRDRDQRRRDRAGLLPRGPLRLVLPAAGARLRARGAGLDAGRADRHAGAVPADAVEGQARQPGVPAPAGPEARLRRDPGARHPPAEPGDHDRGRLPRLPAS